MVAIPKFVVNQLYEHGSLCQAEDGTISFRFQSKLMSGHLTGVQHIEVGGVRFEAEAVMLVVGEGPGRNGSELAEEEPLWVPPQNRLAIQLRSLDGAEVSEGRQEVLLALRSRELGEFQFEIMDELRRMAG